jgi:hypothetical protein
MVGELIEIEKNAGYQAVLSQLQDYTHKIRDIQRKFALSNKDIMSTKLLDNPSLSLEESAQLLELKVKLDRIIDEVAERVEKHRVASYDDYIKNYELTAYDRLRIEALVSSVRKINKSIQKIKFTLENFSRCNKYILKELDNCLEAGEVSKSRMFVLGNIILVFELANYVINFLESFQLEGIDDILVFHQNEIDKITNNMKDLQKLKNDADAPNIDPQVKKQIIANLTDRQQSLEMFSEEWNKYADTIKGVQANVGSVKDKVPTLKLIRDNAQNQLDFYEIMKIFGLIKVAETIRKNLEAIDIVTLPLDELELISLPPHKIHLLIGLSKAAEASIAG